MRYKVVEVSVVVDDVIEAQLNQWCNQGWQLDDIRFVTQDGVRRPTFAFILFTRDDDSSAEESTEAPPAKASDEAPVDEP